MSDVIKLVLKIRESCVCFKNITLPALWRIDGWWGQKDWMLVDLNLGGKIKREWLDMRVRKEIPWMTRVTVLQWMMMPFSKREYWEDRVLQGWVHEFGFAWILFSALHLLCYVVLIEMCGKKLSSIDAVQPGRERDVVMIFFLCNYGYTFISNPNWARSSYNVNSEIILVNLYSYYTKIYWSLWYFERLWVFFFFKLTFNFEKSYTGHVKYSVLLSFTDIPTLNICHSTISQTHIC